MISLSTSFPPSICFVELQKHTGIRVEILAAQVESIPEEISPGLSSAMTGAVSSACEKILQLLSVSGRTQGDQDDV